MITVTCNGMGYTCTTALKGTDYIHLLDSNGQMVAAWDGVSSFSGFSISGGSWTTPTTPDNCYLVTMGDDGVLRKGGHRCSDIAGKQPKTESLTESSIISNDDTIPFYDDSDDENKQIPFSVIRTELQGARWHTLASSNFDYIVESGSAKGFIFGIIPLNPYFETLEKSMFIRVRVENLEASGSVSTGSYASYLGAGLDAYTVEKTVGDSVSKIEVESVTQHYSGGNNDIYAPEVVNTRNLCVNYSKNGENAALIGSLPSDHDEWVVVSKVGNQSESVSLIKKESGSSLRYSYAIFAHYGTGNIQRTNFRLKGKMYVDVFY